MQEDIKLLEELTEEYNSQHYMDMPLINGKQIQAIENLIKGYRNLKAKVKRYEKYLENKDKKFEEALEYEYQERETDYIPKSKIKEKIEELENIRWIDLAQEVEEEHHSLEYMRAYRAGKEKALQELMEDK